MRVEVVGAEERGDSEIRSRLKAARKAHSALRCVVLLSLPCVGCVGRVQLQPAAFPSSEHAQKYGKMEASSLLH